jgi:anti-anti-sigma regulatory factor
MRRPKGVILSPLICLGYQLRPISLRHIGCCLKGIAVTRQIHMIKLGGDLGLCDADAIREQFLATLNEEQDIEVDAAGLTAIDVSVVQVLIAAHKLAAARGRQFQVRAITEGPLHQTMSRVGLLRSIAMPFEINWQMKAGIT